MCLWQQMQRSVESNFKWSPFHRERQRQKKGTSQEGSQAAQTEKEERRAGNAKLTLALTGDVPTTDFPHI